MKPKYIAGLAVGIGLVIVAVLFAVNKQQVYVLFATANESGGQVQVRGDWVKEKGAEYDADNNLFRFTLRDEAGGEMEVHYHDAKPNNFELAEEIVVGGKVENGVFMASSVLTKCPSKYEAESIDVNS
ncbi:MAG: cytochrome c maturation protein CcmE [Ignavibacteriae bacterium]|nr:cytochrome c maturation protein CcmE [Ignavibacteriota bacterium]MCB9216928.1 cytochrome c maturation protein CcmE [Ignavibacteria bacterium]